MSEPTLHESIEKLQAAMRQALNDHERDLLGDMLARIVKGDDSESGMSELKSQAAEFEASHPKLAPSLREIMDVLNKLGI